MSTRKISVALVAGALLATLAGGCDGTYTLADPYQPGIRTVAVPVWTRSKDIYRRGLEDRLTEAVIKRIEADTPYKVTVQARADTLLTGRIEGIQQTVLSFDPNSGQAREKEIVVSVSYEWKDLRSGRVLRRDADMRAGGTYIPPEPFAEDFFQGSETVVNDLAKRIVEQMQAEW